MRQQERGTAGSKRAVHLLGVHDSVAESQVLHEEIEGVHGADAVGLAGHLLAVPQQRRLVALHLRRCHPVLLQPPHLLHRHLCIAAESVATLVYQSPPFPLRSSMRPAWCRPRGHLCAKMRPEKFDCWISGKQRKHKEKPLAGQI